MTNWWNRIDDFFFFKRSTVLRTAHSRLSFPTPISVPRINLIENLIMIVTMSVVRLYFYSTYLQLIYFFPLNNKKTILNKRYKYITKYKCYEFYTCHLLWSTVRNLTQSTTKYKIANYKSISYYRMFFLILDYFYYYIFTCCTKNFRTSNNWLKPMDQSIGKYKFDNVFQSQYNYIIINPCPSNPSWCNSCRILCFA